MLYARLLPVAVGLLICASTSLGALVGITGGADAKLYELDPNTGAVVRFIGSTGIQDAAGFAFHPVTGDLYVHQNRLPLDNGLLYRVNTTTLASTLLGPTNMSVDDLVFSPDGTLYGWMEFHDGNKFANDTVYELVSFNQSNGAGTINGSFPLDTIQNGLAFNSSGELFLKGIRQVVLPGPDDFHSEIYRLNRNTAAIESVVQLHDANLGPGNDIYPNNVLTFDGANHAFSIQRNYDDSDPFIAPIFQSSFLQRIDLTTGAVTTIGGDLGLEFTGLAFTNSLTAVPEPSSTITIISLLGFVAFKRLRNKAKLP